MHHFMTKRSRNHMKRIGIRMSFALMCGVIQAAAGFAADTASASDDFIAAAAGGTILSDTVGESDNPFNKQDDMEVPYDRTRWIQPKEWNCPKIDPKDYQGGIMLYFDKIGLQPEDAPGRTQRVYFSITGAAEPVSSMKFHFFYDTRLTVSPNENGEVLTAGKAVKDFTTGSAMIEEGQLAFYAVGNDTVLNAGSLFTVDFIIPDNAEAGDVYPFGLAYVDDGIAYDCLIDSGKTDAGKLQMTYAFTKGIYNGYIRMIGEKTTTATTVTDPVEVLRGDYNNDQEITVADAVLLARFLAEDAGLTDEQVSCILDHEPDFDLDNRITMLDAAELLAVL